MTEILQDIYWAFWPTPKRTEASPDLCLIHIIFQKKKNPPIHVYVLRLAPALLIQINVFQAV